MKKRLLALLLIVVVLSALAILLTPATVRGSVRAWLWWKARRQGLVIAIDQIDAPFLQPVTLRHVTISSGPKCAHYFSFAAPEIIADLNLRGFLPHHRIRTIRSLSIHDPVVAFRRNESEAGEICAVDWAALHALLSDAISITGLDLSVQDAAGQLTAHGVSLTASELDSGEFFARELEVSSTTFHRQFSFLRGATSWTESRLTLGAVALARGLDLESLTADFRQLAKRKLTLDLRLDAFGGKVLASINGHAGNQQIEWDAAGSAAQISLVQLSETFELSHRALGIVRASKFTFRGASEDLAGATASIWAEVSGFDWNDRSADTIMLGASLYNRRVQVQELYVKQRDNELTLNGQMLLPGSAAEWLRPDFQGTVSASINDLGAFARLFGESVHDFAGQLSLTGSLNTHDRNFGGRVAVEGRKVALFGVPLDSLKGTLNLHGYEIGLEGVELHRSKDFLLGDGTINLAANRAYSGRLNAAVLNLEDYAEFLPAPWLPLRLGGGITLEWTGDGAGLSNSGAFHLLATHLHALTHAEWPPLDANLEGTYSPHNIAFTKFLLTNQQASFAALVSSNPGQTQLQSLELSFHGQRRLAGNISLPIDLSQYWQTGDLLAAFTETKSCAIDLTATNLDLAGFYQALGLQSRIAGSIDGRITATGPLTGLQLKLDGRLQDFAMRADSPSAKKINLVLSLDYDGALAVAQGKASAGDNNVNFEATLPIILNRERLQNGTILERDKEFFASFGSSNFNIATLPDFIPRGHVRSGIFSGNLGLAKSLQQPQIVGELTVREAAFEMPPGFPQIHEIAGQISFDGETARSDQLKFLASEVPFAGPVFIRFADPENLKVSFSLGRAAVQFDPNSAEPVLFSNIAIECAPSRDSVSMPEPASSVDLQLSGSLFAPDWSLTIAQNPIWKAGPSWSDLNDNPPEEPQPNDSLRTVFLTSTAGATQPPREALTISISPARLPTANPQTNESWGDSWPAASLEAAELPACGITLQLR